MGRARRFRLRAGLSLIEIIVTAAILAVATVGFMAAASISLDAMNMSKPRFVAQGAAKRMLARLRTASFPTIYASFWTTPAGQAGEKLTSAGAGVFVGDCAFLDQEITDALTQGLIRPPTGWPATNSARLVIVRFLTEAQADAAWGTVMNLDNNVLVDTGAAMSSYAAYPVVIEVHFADEKGPQKVSLSAIISDAENWNGR